MIILSCGSTSLPSLSLFVACISGDFRGEFVSWLIRSMSNLAALLSARALLFVDLGYSLIKIRFIVLLVDVSFIFVSRLPEYREVLALQGLLGGDALFRVGFEHQFDELDCLGRHDIEVGVFEINFRFFVLLDDRVVAASWEARLAREEDVENEAERIDVANGVVGGAHVGNVDHFRGDESWRAASAVEVNWFVDEGGQSEIGDDDRVYVASVVEEST